MPPTPESFRPRDWQTLTALGLVLFGAVAFSGRSLSTHESVHCQNVREMLADGDWVIPHYGGRAWLERPPLPHWLTTAVVALSGAAHAEWPYRLAAALAGTLVVLLVGWMAATWYGRRVGLLAGAILATLRAHFFYASGAECDIFLAAVVTSATALFVRAEFVDPEPAGRGGFLGRRRWAVLGFFVALGLTNSAKGLFFGLALASVPVAGFLLGQASWPALRRYVWLWGWLAFALAAAAWPAAAYLRQPDVIELWKSDYLGRLNQGYMREPWWYYLANLPYSLLPWGPLAFAGFVQAARHAGNPRGPERFLLCWAVLPVAFLSIPEGKHHHYLLSVLAPWAILAARAAGPAWQAARALPSIWRSPGLAAGLTAVVAVGLAVVFRSKIPLSDGAVAALVAGLAAYVGLLRWAADRPDPTRAAALTCGLIGVGFWAYEGLNTATDAYVADRRFAARVADLVPESEPLFVLNNQHPLDGSWMLFYLPDRAGFLQNVTFLADEGLAGPSVWVVTKPAAFAEAGRYGSAEKVLVSESTRTRDDNPEEVWALYRVRLADDRPRVPNAGVRITACQATGRMPGPFLVTPAVLARAGSVEGGEQAEHRLAGP